MRRPENQNQNQNQKNSDWNRTNEHFSSDRYNNDQDMSRNSRADEYDRYGHNRPNEKHNVTDGQRNRYCEFRESDSWDTGHDMSTASERSFYNGNNGTYGMNNRNGNSSHDNYSNNSFAQNDFRNTSDSERSGHYGKGPKGWKRSDERIQEEVCEALYRDQHLDATNIEVSVKEGTVTLRGSMRILGLKYSSDTNPCSHRYSSQL